MPTGKIYVQRVQHTDFTTRTKERVLTGEDAPSSEEDDHHGDVVRTRRREHAPTTSTNNDMPRRSQEQRGGRQVSSRVSAEREHNMACWRYRAQPQTTPKTENGLGTPHHGQQPCRRLAGSSLHPSASKLPASAQQRTTKHM